MNRKRFQIEINDILNRSNINKENKNNIILISHNKNKSVDLKHSFKGELILKESKRNNSSNRKKSQKLNDRKTKVKEDNIKNINLLTKNNSVSNLLNNKNKKKYFFDENFFKRKNSKNKLNITFKKISQNKKQKLLEGENMNKIIDDSENRDRNKRIVRIKNISNINELSSSNKKNKTEINNIKIHDILYDNKKDGKKPMNKSNLIYIKNKLKGIPYRNKICSTSRVSWSEKDSKLKFNKGHTNNNYLIEDSLDSHNTIVDENNINEYKLYQQNLSYKEINNPNNDNDKSLKNLIPKIKNNIDDSLNNKYQKK